MDSTKQGGEFVPDSTTAVVEISANTVDESFIIVADMCSSMQGDHATSLASECAEACRSSLGSSFIVVQSQGITGGSFEAVGATTEEDAAAELCSRSVDSSFALVQDSSLGCGSIDNSTSEGVPPATDTAMVMDIEVIRSTTDTSDADAPPDFQPETEGASSTTDNVFPGTTPKTEETSATGKAEMDPSTCRTDDGRGYIAPVISDVPPEMSNAVPETRNIGNVPPKTDEVLPEMGGNNALPKTDDGPSKMGGNASPKTDDGPPDMGGNTPHEMGGNASPKTDDGSPEMGGNASPKTDDGPPEMGGNTPHEMGGNASPKTDDVQPEMDGNTSPKTDEVSPDIGGNASPKTDGVPPLEDVASDVPLDDPQKTSDVPAPPGMGSATDKFGDSPPKSGDMGGEPPKSGDMGGEPPKSGDMGGEPPKSGDMGGEPPKSGDMGGEPPKSGDMGGEPPKSGDMGGEPPKSGDMGGEPPKSGDMGGEPAEAGDGQPAKNVTAQSKMGDGSSKILCTSLTFKIDALPDITSKTDPVLEIDDKSVADATLKHLSTDKSSCCLTTASTPTPAAEPFISPATAAQAGSNTVLHNDTGSKSTVDLDNRLYHCKSMATCNNSSAAGRPYFNSPPPPPADGCVQVTFHIIVPQSLWGWDQYSCVHLCFGRKKLGGWRACHGNFTIRDSSRNDLMCEMTCTLPMDVEILKDPLPYKYTVFSPKAVKNDATRSYEYLYGHSKKHDGFINRCLVVTDYEIKNGGSYVQYDTIAYPCEAIMGTKSSKGVDAGVKDSARSWLQLPTAIKAIAEKAWSFVAGTSEGQIAAELSTGTVATASSEGQILLPHKEEHTYSLFAYLTPYSEALCSGAYSTNLVEMAEEVMHIYTLMNHVQISTNKGVKKESLHMSQIMIQFLESMLENLKLKSSEIQFCSSLAVIYCVSGLKLTMSPNAVNLALGMVRLRPHQINKTCSELGLLHELIPGDKRSAVGEAVLDLCSDILSTKGHTQAQWLHALPLVHLLCGHCKPFEEVPRPKELKWADSVLQHKSSGKFEIQDVMEHYQQLQDLIELDPLLLPIVVHVCPKKELAELFKYISPSVSITYMSYLVSTEEWAKAKVDEYTVLLTVIRQTLEAQFKISVQNQTLLEACSLLLSEASMKMKKSSHKDNSLGLLKALVPLVLLAHNKCIIPDSEINKHKGGSDGAIFEQLTLMLGVWITSKDVMGSESFGGKDDTFYSSWRGKDELKLWQEVLHFNYATMSGNTLDTWYAVVSEQIKKRIHQVTDKMKLKLVCYLEEISDVHPLLVNVVFESGVKAIDSICDKDGKEVLDQINELVQKESDRIGKLIGCILLKKYPGAASSAFKVTFNDLMEWDVWPCFIKISGSTSKIKDGLNNQCITACKAAVSRLAHVCGQLASGEILVKELLRANKREHHLVLLCEAAGQPSVVANLKQRNQELEAYHSHCKLLHHMLAKAELPDNTQGLLHLNAELEKDVQSLSIKALCTKNSDGGLNVIFLAAGPLNNVAAKFHIMTSEFSSSTFLMIWKHYLKETIAAVSQLRFDDVCECVWTPSLQWCWVLVNSCKDKSIKLSAMDIIFRNEGKLDTEISNLSQGTSLCMNGHNGTTEWIHSTCAHMRDYWMLCTCKEAAAVVLELTKSVPLKGDFRNINELCTGIENTMKDDSLNKISDDLIKAGKFLRGIATNGKKKECLDAFQKCLPLRTWLRKVTKGVNDLNRFVTIALSTATGGEDALTQDKLSNLRTAGSGYAPLIYSLKKDAGFNEFSDCCSRVWSTLEGNPHLPTILNGCLAHLDWYKHIKQNIGSVEESSFRQLENIQLYGEYSVSVTDLYHCSQSCIQDVVHLNLSTDNPSVVKALYSLDELRDLESRLILVTSCDAKNREKVDLFIHTLHSMCRIAEVLVELKREGNISYNGWKLTCSCTADCVQELKEQAKLMEEDLQHWRLQLMEAREIYYELNYYTNAQLLVIREELADGRAVSPGLLMLLQSISPNVTEQNIQQAVELCFDDGIDAEGDIEQDLTHKLRNTPWQPAMTKPGLNVCNTVGDAGWLTLQQVGDVLCNLSGRLQGAVVNSRPFPSTLVPGKPNLISIDLSNMLKVVLSIYMGDLSSPLPTLEEVLLCSEQTSEEEAQLLFRRAIGDPGYKRIFCLVHAEKLSYRVADNVLRLLDEITQGHSDYRLVIICCNEEMGMSHVAAKLQMFRRHFNCNDDTDYVQYLSSKLVLTPPSHKRSRFVTVHTNRPCVQVVSSTRSGMGKSLYVRRMAEAIRGSKIVCIPVHGPDVTSDAIMGLLNDVGDSHCTLFHFDVAPNVLHQVDSILFSLLVLRGLIDSLGTIWRCFCKDIYIVEVTLPGPENTLSSGTVSFLNLLPSTKCLSPLESIRRNDRPGYVSCDEGIFLSEGHQLVYRYLCTIYGSHGATAESVTQVMLQAFIQHCGLNNPSWSELDHFITFLAVQLRTCEESVYCNELNVGDALRGMKNFVVKFMVRMSKDFSIPSLHGELANERNGLLPEGGGEEAVNDIAQYQIVEQKKWEKSSHPYLFFNKDGVTFTFVGFIVTPEGHLVDPPRQDLQRSTSPHESCVQGQFNPQQEWFGSQHMLQGYVQDRPMYSPVTVTSSISSLYSASEARQTQLVHSTIPAQRGRQTCSSVAGSRIIERSIMTPDLYEGLKLNLVNFAEDYQRWTKDEMIRKLTCVMGLDMDCKDPDPSYALTVDNLIKILAIQMRFRCGIPVVLMGESGCGKTRLVQYMCDLAAQSTQAKNMVILKVHGGTTQVDIMECVIKSEGLAESNSTLGLDTVVFFDEANTTEAIGLIKELMCDRRMNGRPISKELKFIAACNPYRRHSDDMITKLESAGLGFYVKVNETQERLGKTPLRHLVYRVLELPPSMRSLMYDFGQLDTTTEADYVTQIVENQLGQQFPPKAIHALSHVLCWSQQYMKDQKDECSYVSLRDVKRAVIVFDYFYNKSPFFSDTCGMQEEKFSSSLVLSLSVCYDARLLDRDEYEEEVCKEFRSPLSLPEGARQFRGEVKRCQEALLASMEVGPSIAHNVALRENVFMMVICIELRIPLFIIGKPGSSKSLAKSIVTSSMQGAGSSKSLLKHFKEVYVVSYQCSQHSTPESIKEVFKTAQTFQEKQDHNLFVSVVVLDEVGLAEDSPHLPLKALHPLLEDGTLHDSQATTTQRVAFIGISNWALDPAKMNRGLMLTRGEPSIQELSESARGICSDLKDTKYMYLRKLEQLFEPLAQAYQAISRNETKIDGVQKEFFGLRDFYSLIKMLYSICKTNKRMPSWIELNHAIHRNFGGREGFDPTEEFRCRIKMHMLSTNPLGVVPDNSLLGMIRTSLKTKDTTLNGESRYLLFLTENYSALQILLHYLKDVVMSHSSSGNSIEPYVLFGSSFPKDRGYTQICQNVNRIKLCMETGRTVILLNLENLYESLYDALNQYYIKYDKKRYVDLGLQAHKVKCMVHENFKLVLIAEKRTVYEKFPIPLISRLEKHFVVTSSVFSDWQNDVLRQLSEWTKKFSIHSDYDRSSDFKVEDAFIGCQTDTPAAVIFQATKHCQLQIKECRSAGKVHDVLGSICVDDLKCHGEGSEYWKNAVLLESKHLLLQTTTPDAVLRLDQSFSADYKAIQSKYFKHMHHPSLLHYLRHQICDFEDDNGHMMQVTTHSHVLSHRELQAIATSIKVQSEVIYLHEFDTEIDFSNKIRSLIQRQPGQLNGNVLLVIQCQSGHLCGDLIACARYRVGDERVKAIQQTHADVQHMFKSPGPQISVRSTGCTHVLFIIYLPRQTPSLSFVGFQGDPWKSLHIDELRQADDEIVSADIFEQPISKLFYHPQEGDITHLLDRGVQYHYHKRLRSCIQAAVAMLQHSSQIHNRGTKLVAALFGLIPEAPPLNLDEVPFYKTLVKHIYFLMQQLEQMLPQSKKWALNEALSHKSLRQGGTLRNTLIRKIDGVIVPILAHVISHIDQYSNLSLYNTNNCNPVGQLWLSIFRDSSVVQFNYKDITGPKSYISETGTTSFDCQLPFFWMIKETIEANMTVLGFSCSATLNDKILSLPIGKILKLVQTPYHRELFQRYLHDFVACTYPSLLRDQPEHPAEFKLVSDALDGLVPSGSSLVDKMIALHEAYLANKSCLMWFGNLLSCIPKTITSLKSKASPEQLAIHAVEQTVIYLKPPLEKDQKSMLQWLLLVQKCQVTVETLLSILPTANTNKLRHNWHCIRAVQMFMEHIGSRYEGMQNFAQQMFKDISACPQIAMATTIKKIKSILIKIDCSGTRALEQSCHTFFIELISQLCFGHELPNQDLIRLLFDTVFKSKLSEGLSLTRQLSYKEEDDSVPVIRSSLLQLLLKHSFNLVHEYLQEYIQRSAEVLQKVSVNNCQLYLLCIKCFQDVIHARYEHMSLRERASVASTLLDTACQYLVTNSETVAVGYIEAVARTRIGLLIAGDILHEDSHVPINASLLTAVKDICTNKCINILSNKDAIGPNIFLLKVLARSYGMSFLKKVATQHTWLLPPQLLNEKEPQPDPFVAYGPMYCVVRDRVADAMYGRNLKRLEETSNDLEAHERVFINFALYEVVTLSWVDHQQGGYTPGPEVVAAFENCKVLSDKLRIMARTLLLSKKESLLVGLCTNSTQHGLLSAIVVHTAAAMFSRQGVPLLRPFVTMLSNPAELVNAYLPTMAEDVLPQVQAVLYSQGNPTGRFYECPMGHRYFVGECGRPTVQGTCPDCGASIGGVNHQPAVNNRDAHQLSDSSQRGYTLPAPEQRSSDPLPERHLSPIACCLVRIVMHSALFWNCCTVQGTHISDGLGQLLKLRDAPTASRLLLGHLDKDFETLRKAISKSELECAVLVHAVLQHVMSVDCPGNSSSQLNTANQRSEWEKTFSEAFIIPVLKNMGATIPSVVNDIMNDKKEYGRLMYIVNEKMAVGPSDLNTHAWAFHPNISLRNLHIAMESQSLQSKYPILHNFLQNEHTLRATQYIPDIYKLQNFLYSRYNHRLDHKDASTITIAAFVRQLPAHSSIEVEMMLESVNKAWRLCRSVLKKHSRIQIEDKYLIPSLTSDVSLEHIIPTTSGAGVCTTILLDFLVCKHNGFLEECKTIAESESENCKVKLQLPRVPIQHIQQFHTLDHEAQLCSVISSHCEYSLMTGRDHDVQYDFFGIQKQLINQFISGKPIIVLDIPRVVYRKDIHSIEYFSKIKEKLRPQVKLPVESQQEILAELVSIPHLKETLDTLETVIAFLTTEGGVHVEMKLSSYAESLKIQFSSKIGQHCKLSHVLSLWETVSVALARQHVIRKQEPFEGITFHSKLTRLQTQKLESALRQFKLDQLVVKLYLFISIYVRNALQQERTTSIINGMDLFHDIYDDAEDAIPELATHFPADITLEQAVEAWKQIVEYQNRVEGQRLI